MTNWDSALDLKKAPRTKEQDKKKEKQKKHTNTRGEKNFLNASDLQSFRMTLRGTKGLLLRTYKRTL
jgi:hypothetical protein